MCRTRCRKQQYRYRYSAAVLAIVFNAGSTASALEEVVITAQTREQNLQEVGISVSASYNF